MLVIPARFERATPRLGICSSFGLSGYEPKFMPNGREVLVVWYRIGGRNGETKKHSLGTSGSVAAELQRMVAAQVSMASI